MEFSYEIKIPKDRVAVLVGIKGSVKRKIEKALEVNIEIDSKEGDVFLEGNDSLKLLNAQNIVRAIGRGFNPEFAFDLLDEDNYLEILDISDFTGDSKSNLARVKARVIGTGGKARKTIEVLTITKIVVYGKTIGMIGSFEGVALARKAFESLLSGNRHSTVYAWLQKQRKQMRVSMY
ncbi:RNA-processing protein [Candidatus Woesearchaeota archaeon]|nr:RNA-processing protein [Candidatus Woesearchaeota archaeon]